MEDGKKKVKKEEKKKFEKVDVKKEAKNNKEKKPKEKKSENKISKIAIISICAILVIGIIVFVLLKNNKSGPEKAVEDLFNSVKNYSTNDEDDSYNELIQSTSIVSDVNAEMKKLLFEKLEWKVLKVTENSEDNTAIVEVEILNKNIETAYNNRLEEIIKNKVSLRESVSQEDYDKYLAEQLKKEDLEVVTVTRNIEMEKDEEGKWKVKDMNAFVNDLFPGFKEAINAYSLQNK